MMTVMCPNCRHRFPAPGCCSPGSQINNIAMHQSLGCGSGSYYNCTGILIPRGNSNNNNNNNNNNINSNHHHHHHHHHYHHHENYDNVNDNKSSGGESSTSTIDNSKNDKDNDGGCFINAPTIINGPTIIQSLGDNVTNRIESFSNDILNDHQLWRLPMKNKIKSIGRKINTICDLTGGTMTITTPNIQSGGCVIENDDTGIDGIDAQPPHIEIKSHLSGGGCLVQKRVATENDSSSEINFTDDSYSEALNGVRFFEENSLNEDKSEGIMLISAPSGCQELPGIRRQNSIVKTNNDCSLTNNLSASKLTDKNTLHDMRNQNTLENKNGKVGCCCGSKCHSCKCGRRMSNESTLDNKNRKVTVCCCGSKILSCNNDDYPPMRVNDDVPTTDVTSTKTQENSNSGSVQIQVNATVQIPPNIGQCVVNITATTNQSNIDTSINAAPTTVKSKNNFNGGGIIDMTPIGRPPASGNIDRRDHASLAPVSWIMPFSCGFEHYPEYRDSMKLSDVKRLLHTSGWYHEGLSWQQSENLLKNASIGRWLMRDSSDSRYKFAISVQTERGPTSVRVHYLFGRFRLDSEPRLTLAMPLFDCPIKMLEYYVKYSTAEENRREVWVDYSGQLYSQIFLTQPLVKEVRPLLHLARLVVNKNNINTDHLPLPIKNYIDEYPHSF